MFPPLWTAASLVPSLEDVMLAQSSALPTEVSSVHAAPESVDVQIYPFVFPPPSAAASFVPSLDEVMQLQVFALPTEVRSVQVASRISGGPDAPCTIINEMYGSYRVRYPDYTLDTAATTPMKRRYEDAFNDPNFKDRAKGHGARQATVGELHDESGA